MFRTLKRFIAHWSHMFTHMMTSADIDTSMWVDLSNKDLDDFLDDSMEWYEMVGHEEYLKTVCRLLRLEKPIYTGEMHALITVTDVFGISKRDYEQLVGWTKQTSPWDLKAGRLVCCRPVNPRV